MLHDPELHYLDNAATTIVAPEVADVIDKAIREHWANPSSLYAPGARSEEALNAARAAVARTLGCKSKELYFTSCGARPRPAPSARASWCRASNTPASSARWNVWPRRAITSLS